MKRETASMLLALAGVMFACLAALDAADYQGFIASLGWR